jgi:hypothetical protein
VRCRVLVGSVATTSKRCCWWMVFFGTRKSLYAFAQMKLPLGCICRGSRGGQHIDVMNASEVDPVVAWPSGAIGADIGPKKLDRAETWLGNVPRQIVFHV